MSDLVKRLRHKKSDILGNLILRNEAADEIERLQAALRSLEEMGPYTTLNEIRMFVRAALEKKK